MSDDINLGHTDECLWNEGLGCDCCFGDMRLWIDNARSEQ